MYDCKRCRDVWPYCKDCDGDEGSGENSHCADPSGYALRVRPKWSRVLRWPIVWCYHFRLMCKNKQGTLADKIHIAYLWANLSVTYKHTRENTRKF